MAAGGRACATGADPHAEGPGIQRQSDVMMIPRMRPMMLEPIAIAVESPTGSPRVDGPASHVVTATVGWAKGEGVAGLTG